MMQLGKTKSNNESNRSKKKSQTVVVNMILVDITWIEVF